MRRRLPFLVSLVALLAVGVPVAAAAAPSVTATWINPAGVLANSAVLRAKIDPEGPATSYRIEYLPEADFLAHGFTGAVRVPSGTEPGVGSGTAPVAVVRSVGALKAATAYRYRFLATNEDGSTPGPIHWLTTDEPEPVFALPDLRGWEMVSPVDKNGGEIQGFGANFGGGVLQAAAAGGAVTYSSASSFADAQGAPGASQYVSRRSPSGWSTENVTLATESGAYGDHPDGVPYRLFSTDLSGALILDGHRCTVAVPCPRSYSLRQNATGTVSPLPYQEPDLAFAGASPNLTQIALSTCAALTSDAIEVPGSGGQCDPEKANLYERSGAGLELINLLPGETIGTPGAELAAQSRAISADGSRVYWTDKANLFLFDEGEAVQVDAGVGGGGTFQIASVDGSVAFFTKGGHLYLYLAASDATTDLTPAGGVTGVLGASDNGAYVYYATAAGLFLWRSEVPVPSSATTVSVVSKAVDPGSYPATTGSARVSADGSHLAFVSAAELVNYDNTNQVSASPEPEVYLYTAASGGGEATLACASCNPSGESPIGAAGLPGASPNGTGAGAPETYKPRVLSVDSRRLFFDSRDALAPQDTNKDQDVYQWEAAGSGSCAKPSGCVNLISSGRSEGGASFVDASADGSDAFFLTDGSLVPFDPGSVDVYDARVGGGFPLSPTAIPCIGDDCQVIPPEPEDPTPGTLRVGSGNPPALFPRDCGKGRVKKKGRCVKKKHHRHGKRGTGR